MVRFLVNTLINAVGLWLVTTIVPPIKLAPYGGGNTWFVILSYLLVAAIFGLVHAVIGPVIKVLSFPLYILTFGLINLVINGALLLFVAWLSQLIGSPIFSIDGFTHEGLAITSLGWAILGGLILSVLSFIGRKLFTKALR
ncbi:MAG: phage holin family protein [Micrococcales bacterium]